MLLTVSILLAYISGSVWARNGHNHAGGPLGGLLSSLLFRGSLLPKKGAIWPSLSPCTVINPILLTYFFQRIYPLFAGKWGLRGLKTAISGLNTTDRRETVTWTSGNPNPWYHMTSWNHSELTVSFAFGFQYIRPDDSCHCFQRPWWLDRTWLLWPRAAARLGMAEWELRT